MTKQFILTYAAIVFFYCIILIIGGILGGSVAYVINYCADSWQNKESKPNEPNEPMFTMRHCTFIEPSDPNNIKFGEDVDVNTTDGGLTVDYNYFMQKTFTFGISSNSSASFHVEGNIVVADVTKEKFLEILPECLYGCMRYGEPNGPVAIKWVEPNEPILQELKMLILAGKIEHSRKNPFPINRENIQWMFDNLDNIDLFGPNEVEE
uniref:Uncharacterized protein n=1 Tax=viral metagenome TaxID=1070528 RepID=A0A6M3KN35_9ZZZZ